MKSLMHLLMHHSYLKDQMGDLAHLGHPHGAHSPGASDSGRPHSLPTDATPTRPLEVPS